MMKADEILSSSNGNLEGQNTPENKVEYWIEYDGKDYDSDMKDRKYIFTMEKNNTTHF